MKGKTIIITLLTLIFAINIVSAGYKVNDVMLNDSFTITQEITAEDEYFVYKIIPSEYRTVEITLSGSLGYIPRLLFYDPVAEEDLDLIVLSPNDVLKYSYTTGYLKGEPKEYYLVLETAKSQGMTFTLNYKAKKQDDAGQGDDATNVFRDGIILKQGIYNGFLGDEDEKDYYKLKLSQGDRVELTLIPKEESNMLLKLIDSNYNPKINKRSYLETGEIKGLYKSEADQIVYLGIEGNSAYTIKINLTTKDGVNLPINNQKENIEYNQGEPDNQEELKKQLESERLAKKEAKIQKEELEKQLESERLAKEEKNQIKEWYFIMTGLIILIILGASIFLLTKKYKKTREQVK